MFKGSQASPQNNMKGKAKINKSINQSYLSMHNVFIWPTYFLGQTGFENRMFV